MEVPGAQVIDLRATSQQVHHGPLEAVGVRVSHIPIIDETRPPPDWEDAGSRSTTSIS
jgi:hypothetical protein